MRGPAERDSHNRKDRGGNGDSEVKLGAHGVPLTSIGDEKRRKVTEEGDEAKGTIVPRGRLRVVSRVDMCLRRGGMDSYEAGRTGVRWTDGQYQRSDVVRKLALWRGKGDRI